MDLQYAEDIIFSSGGRESLKTKQERQNNEKNAGNHSATRIAEKTNNSSPPQVTTCATLLPASLLPESRHGSGFTREIITQAACTSTRSWRPIIPRGAPRGMAFFAVRTKDQERPPLRLFPSPRLFLLVIVGAASITAIIVFSVVVARAAKRSRRHSKDTLHLEVPGEQHPQGVRTACQLVSPVYRYCQPFTYPLPSPSNASGLDNVTFRCIELIDAARYLATGFINCIDAPPAARRSAAVAPGATGGRNA
ncbi:uncharacterized protein LOC143358139 [Halictus rubicundus]|uniref:uncharacterized protein LOC143358139 n=1 Tax=Halictus rubicundus TaxID=77578 RepID=UPI0040367B5D